MPNWCENSVSIYGSKDTISKIRNLLLGENNVFDFEKIIPMPDYIYRGNLGKEEEEIYGENNWYDWSCKNWGTKWNSCHAICKMYENELYYYFNTAWGPCFPVVETFAAMFPDVKILYSFSEPDWGYYGERQYENGHKVYETDGEYQED